nr:prolyl oligopeptidase family serine peptidase [Allomuricauda sp.]
MKNIFYILVCCGLMLVENSIAQDTIQFNEGLVIRTMARGSRSAVYNDQLYHQWVTGNFASPKAGDKIDAGELIGEQQWETITINDEGVFQDNLIRGGYLFLSYNSPKSETRILDISGHTEVYVNGVPRGGDIYNKRWVLHPVQLKKGENTFLIKGGRPGLIDIKLLPVQKPVFFTQRDMTQPDLLTNENNDKWAAIRILNTTNKTLKNLRIVSEINGIKRESKLPPIIPNTSRKMPYVLNDAVSAEGEKEVSLKLYEGNRLMDQTLVGFDVVEPSDRHVRTFISDIDGSVQYFAVRPGNVPDGVKPALFLSLHGAGVKAKGMAGTYKPKDWGHVVSPTNRREFGFDWEDWGRWDAMEVFGIAEKMYDTDPKHTYLKGHSMGGHGTWQIGATFPGKWAAIAPLAGWYSFYSYGGKRDLEEPTPIQKMLMRASHSSNTLELARNYLHYGISIHHGDLDTNVPTAQARFMRSYLAEYHPDFTYFEHKGRGHVFGMDHQMIFDYFKWHSIPENGDVDEFEFSTASPGISCSTRFITLYQQEKPFEFSRVKVNQNILTRRQKRREKLTVVKNRKIEVTTENLGIFKMDLAHTAKADSVSVTIDGANSIDLTTHKGKEVWFHKTNGIWKLGEAPINTHHKNPTRYGNFKDAFRNKMVFVYSTKGTKAENEWSIQKARFDAETFYYRGNGSIDIVSDREFIANGYKDRSVILYGNSSTNAAWNVLLKDSPIQVKRGKLIMDDKQLEGKEWGSYFIRPRKDSKTASVGVVTGTGMEGFRAAMANRYFISGTGYPDFLVFSHELYRKDYQGVKAAGYFGNDWSIKNGDMVWNPAL